MYVTGLEIKNQYEIICYTLLMEEESKNEIASREQSSRNVLEDQIISEWFEGKEKFIDTFQLVEEIRTWVTKNGKRKRIDDVFKSVYYEEEMNGSTINIEAVDFEKYPDSFMVLNGEVLKFNLENDEFDVLLTFSRSAENPLEGTDFPFNDPFLNELFIETTIAESGDDGQQIVFPKKPTYLASGPELYVASSLLSNFIKEKTSPRPPDQS